MMKDIAGPATGAILGIAMQGHNDRRQLKQQKKLQDLQIAGSKELTDYNKGKDLDMWNATNYGAQKEHMQRAGLNVGLMYGGAGAGGTTGGAGGSVTGGASPAGGGEIGMGIQQGMQLQLLKAQKENIEADTDNKKAEIPDKQNKGGLSGIDLENKTANKDKLREAEGWKADKEIMSGEQANLEWEAMKTAIKGSMTDEENPLVKSKLAEINKKTEELENLRKQGRGLNDAHDIAELEKEIMGFTADLTDLGLNPTTTNIIGLILKALTGVRIKKK